MNHTQLIERLRKAEGPDREIDGEFALLSGWTHEKKKGDSRPYWRKPGVTGYYMRSDLPPFTASIDSALSLVERLIPGAQVGLDPIFFVDPEAVKWDAIICIAHMDKWNPVNTDWIERIEARHSNRVLAILIAVLTALQARSTE